MVYRARQDRLQRYVAVKALTTRLDEQAARRFAQEGQALGAVSDHPNIVAVHEAGTAPDGTPYLVMPYCERGSLADRLRATGPLPWPEVLHVGIGLAGALQTAHAAGVLHRDIKPGNVLVDGYGTARLADFGQARLADAEATRTGEAVTTPAYAAPEVLSGGTGTPSSDVYSLGVTLAALMLGRSPFSHGSGEGVAAVMYRVLHDPLPDLRQHGVPDPMAAVLAAATAKDPARRPLTADTLGHALQGVQQSLGLPISPLVVPEQPPDPDMTVPRASLAPSPPQRPRPRRIRWLVPVAVLAAAGLAAGLFFGLRSGSGDKPDAGRLLLSAADYPGAPLASDQTVPSVFSSLLGDNQPVATDVARCLELPMTSVRAYQTSAVFAAGPQPGTAGGGQAFTAMQSAGLIMASAAKAAEFVDNWSGPNFDKCRNRLVGAGSIVLRTSLAPVIPKITFSKRPPAGPPAGGSSFGAEVDVPLRDAHDAITHLFLNMTLFARGSSVAATVLINYPTRVPSATLAAVQSAMAGKLSRR